jgi:hypothetical protein
VTTTVSEKHLETLKREILDENLAALTLARKT